MLTFLEALFKMFLEIVDDTALILLYLQLISDTIRYIYIELIKMHLNLIDRVLKKIQVFCFSDLVDVSTKKSAWRCRLYF